MAELIFLELFYPFAVHNLLKLLNLLIMTRIFAANKLLNKNMWGQAEKNGQQLSVEIYFVFVPWHITWSERVHKCWACAPCTSNVINVIALVLLFHRKFRQTTISQNLLIKSWRPLPKILFMSPFRQWKPQNKFLKSSFVTQSSFS